MQATLRKKLGLETEPHLILGACNPTFAHQALELEPELGVLLPCNVVVFEHGEQTFVSAVDAPGRGAGFTRYCVSPRETPETG